MADSPPVTRKRGKHNNGDRSSARDRRYASNDRKSAADSERVMADKRKKLLRAIPTSIAGVTGLLKSEAKRDLKEMGAFVGMEVLDAEEIAPGGTMVTPRPLIPKANHLEEKRARLARWENDPSLVEKDMAKQREAVTRAEEKDALMKSQQETWEQGYLVLRAHLMARHRPTVSWLRTAEVTTSSDAALLAPRAAASSKFAVPAAGEMEAPSKEENGRASRIADGEGPDGGNSRCNGVGDSVANNIHTRKREGGVSGGLDATGGGIPVWSCEGGEGEEEAGLRELEQVAMERAGLEGEFDMKKVIKVLADRSRQVMSARSEYAALLAQQQPHSRKEKDNGNDEAKSDLDKAHPGDIALLERWEELLRVGGLMGMGRRASNEMDDAFNEALDAEESLLRTKSASLLIPRGLDLPPSMRALRYPTLLQQIQQEQQQEEKREEATRAKEASRNDSSMIEMEVDDSDKDAALSVAKRTAGAIECVPWLGIGEYSGGVGGGQVSPTMGVDAATKDPGSMQTTASVKGCIGDRVQWFPRSVPMEMAKSEGGYDERQSAYYISRTSQVMDRLRSLMKEMAKRQKEMELRRRQKVEESVGLVRAVADHEKLRQEHLKRMKSLRKQLEKLETAKRKNSSAAAANESGGESTNDAEAKDESSSEEDEDDQGSETISSFKFNPVPGPISPPASGTNTDMDISMDTASDDGSGGSPTADAGGPAAYAAAPPASPASAATAAAGVTMATTRSRSPLIRGVRKTRPVPTPMPIKGKSKGKGKGREEDVSGWESTLGYQQQPQAARGSRREEDAASVTSSTSPTSPPSSSPCASPSSGLEKTAVVVGLRDGDEALSNDGGGDEGDRVGDEGSGGWGGLEGDGCNDEKEENIASDSKTPMVEAFFRGLAADSRKCALGEEAGDGVAVRVASKRRRSVNVVMAMSPNDKTGAVRNVPTVNGEAPGASLLLSCNTVDQTSAALDSNSLGNDVSMGASGGRGGKSKVKAATGGKRGGSNRRGSRGRRGGRK